MNSVTQEQVDEILDNSYINVQKIFDKCTVVSVQLPNGFILVESSSCVDPINYNHKIGTEICLARIKNKIWELEGYKLQDKVGVL